MDAIYWSCMYKLRDLKRHIVYYNASYTLFTIQYKLHYALYISYYLERSPLIWTG